MDSDIALPGKGSPEISGIALIRAPKMGVGNYFEPFDVGAITNERPPTAVGGVVMFKPTSSRDKLGKPRNPHQKGDSNPAVRAERR
jgi:hypothetical protein